MNGSGKTAMIVREMYLSKQKTYSNIQTKRIKNNIEIAPDMIFEKELIKEKKDGTPVYKKKLNVDFWRTRQDEDGGVNVIIDEIHTLLNSRRGMTQTAKVMLDLLALLRRVLGGTEEGGGELVLITQLQRRLDVVAQDMATKVQFCRCHYTRYCKCGYEVLENNETPQKMVRCFKCGKLTKRKNFVVEVFSFINIKAYEMFDYHGMKTFYDHYYIEDIEKYFPMYDTLQWDNLITDD